MTVTAKTALDHVDMSTNELAKSEGQEAAKADEDRGSAGQRDWLEEGRSHQRSGGDRPDGRQSSS